MQAFQVDEAAFVGSILVTMLDTDGGAHAPLARVIVRRIPKDPAAVRAR